MSWSIFKQELLLKMQNPNGNDESDFGNFFTRKYDECMRRGVNVITNNTVIRGNTELMEAFVTYGLKLTTQGTTDAIYNEILLLLGKGAVAYWTGAKLGFTPPITPAPGTILNISVISNDVLNPGTWPETPLPIFPALTPNQYIDSFILLANIHLQTISGLCTTISQYPPIAPAGPGFIPWTGYTVDTSIATPEANFTPPQNLSPQTKPELSAKDFIMSVEDLQSELDLYTNALSDKNLLEQNTDEESKVKLQTINEFLETKEAQLKNKTKMYVDAEASDVKDDKELPDYVKRALNNARKDLGVLEIKGKPNQGVRINEMLKDVGLPNKPAPGEPGYKWCAAAVSSWWRDAGLKVPTPRHPGGDALCQNWLNWGKSNGLFTKTPTEGAAVIYGNAKGTATHIGIIEYFNKQTKEIITIQGNTSSDNKFNRDGDGVFRKKGLITDISATGMRILGYILPVPK